MGRNISTAEELSRDFFRGRVDQVAKNLLGKLLVYKNDKGTSAGIIVETEAYLGREDPASHLVKAGEKRKQVFEKGAGTVYIFKIYQHNNLNFITNHGDTKEGVLIRALEPVKGIELMKQRRGVEEQTEIASGPGKLTQALGVRKEEENARNIEYSKLSVQETGVEPVIEETPRIGISKAKDWPLRFTVRNNPHISTETDIQPLESFNIEDYYI